MQKGINLFSCPWTLQKAPNKVTNQQFTNLNIGMSLNMDLGMRIKPGKTELHQSLNKSVQTTNLCCKNSNF